MALKLPLDDDVDLDAIRQEAAVWVAASGHPNVLPMLEARRYDGHVIIASEYAPDGSLQQWLKANGGKAPTLEAALAMTRGILAGLAHLHSRRIIHRDLKPDNILLNGTTPRIADFGISRVLKSTSLSMVMAGTPVYMAPEAFKGKRSQQTDLWSIGVILYQMLSGRLPCVGADWPEIMYAVLNEELSPLPSSFPSWVRHAVMTALNKDPTNRFKTAEEMEAALSGTQSASQPKPQQPTPTPETEVEIATIERPRRVEPKQPTPVNKDELPASFIEDLNGVPLEMIFVPSGKFLMGSPEGVGNDDERPQHEVTVPAFYCGKYPVTQAQWQAVMGSNPSYFKGNLNRPVEQVSWAYAKAFCARLNTYTGKTYRLPSEAEWEYACRAGTTGDYAGELNKMAWHYKNAGNKTHPVGKKQANKFGLYDMHGNVWEWCEDTWHGNYQGAPIDGSAWLGARSSGSRVLRGGSWRKNLWPANEVSRSASRNWYESGNSLGSIGFRVVLTAKTP